jgi:hypothetical protein
MRQVWVVIPLVLIGIIGMIGIQESDASCVQNRDWSSAPCFDTGSPSKTEFVERWTPYYEYKGSELMERKKIEMFQSLENKTFEQWIGSSENPHENHNVYSYYMSTGEVAKQSSGGGFYVEEITSPHKQQSIHTKPYNLNCKNNLLPVLLQSETYACVKEESREKLLELNLIHKDYSNISILRIEDENDVNTPFYISIRNEGMVPIHFESSSIQVPMFQTRNQAPPYDEKLLYPGGHASQWHLKEKQLDESLKLGKNIIEINYKSDIHQLEKSVNYEINIVDPLVTYFSINFPDDWSITKLINSQLTSYYSQDMLEKYPELDDLKNAKPWVISDREHYHSGYTAISENFDLLGIAIQKHNITASKYFEIWNEVCNNLDAKNYGCIILQNNKTETSINNKSVIIYNFVENKENERNIDGETRMVFQQNFITLIELVNEQETWLVRGNYAISSELSESKEIITDDVFQNIMNSFKIHDYEY